MKIKNISELKNRINRAIFLIFIVIFFAALLIYLAHIRFLQNNFLFEKEKITESINIYNSSLSGNLAIVASSPIFLDYLRSGNISRERLYPQFLSELSTLKEKSILGMEVIDKSGKSIFFYGKNTDSNITLNLCYLNQNLDKEMGDCTFSWKIYLDKEIVLNELLTLNKSLKICSDCVSYSLIANNSFGVFPVKSSAKLDFNLSLIEEKNYFFYVYFILIVITLIVFSSWSWYRLSDILNNYIANPIKIIADCLKANKTVVQSGNLDEIKYLVGEINTWKNRINKMKEDERAVELARVGAQLAHDIRSPLMAIDMITKKFTSVSDEYKKILQQATSRISDIANNFLVQYKQKALSKSPLSKENIAELLHNIIAEKREQYSCELVIINFNIVNDAANLFCYVNSTDFKRIISNIINNSVEAAQVGGVSVTISLLYNDKAITIKIIDNGKGISPELMPNIFSGVSEGKLNGTGLGLSHAKATIEEWSGSLNIVSQVGMGSQVSIILPVCL